VSEILERLEVLALISLVGFIAGTISCVIYENIPPITLPIIFQARWFLFGFVGAILADAIALILVYTKKDTRW